MNFAPIAFRLKAKFISFIVLLLIVFTVLITLHNIQSQETVIQQRLLNKALSITSLLAAGVSDAMGETNNHNLMPLLTNVLSQDEVSYVYVFDHAGYILTDGHENPSRKQPLNDPVSLRAVAVDSVMVQMTHHILDVAKAIDVNQKKLGGVRVGFSLAKIQTEITEIEYWNFGFGAGFIVFGTILTVFFVGHVTRPLKVLTEATQAVSMGDLDRQIEVHTSDELHTLSEAFNQMTNHLKLSQTALIATRDYTENILRSMNDALFVMTPKGYIETVNIELCNLLGYAESELLEQPAQMLFASDQDGFFDGTMVAQLLQHGTIRNVEKRLLTKTKREIPVLLSGAMLQNPAGETLGMVCAARNITNRLAAEAALRESEARFRMLSESAFEGIFIHQGGVILDANDQFARMLGFSKGSELIGKNCWRFVGRQARLMAITHIRDNNEQPFEATICPKKGEEFPIEVIGRSVPYAGKTVGVVAVRDIRERKQADSARRQLERQLVQSERMAAMGTVAAGIVHNLKNPLTSILGYAEMLKMKHPHLSEVDRIVSASENMHVMIENILAKNRQKKTPDRVDLNHLLKQELDFLYSDPFFQKEVKTEIHLDLHLPIVSGVYSDFAQIFGILLRNAIEAMYDQNEKILTVVTTHLTGEGILVEILDTGCGIPKAHLEKLFDPFYTTKTGDNDRPQGTGLGLYMARQLLNAYGGMIDVESEEKKGAKFCVRIPMKTVPQTEEKS